MQKSYFSPDVVKDGWKCDGRSDTGFYAAVCRGWFKLQESNPDLTTLGDLYTFAGDGSFGLTFCVPLKQNGEFHAALCYDLNISQTPVYTLSTDSRIQADPLILQRDKEDFSKFITDLALKDREVVNEEESFLVNWVDHSPTTSRVFDGVSITTGEFTIPSSLQLSEVT